MICIEFPMSQIDQKSSTNGEMELHKNNIAHSTEHLNKTQKIHKHPLDYFYVQKHEIYQGCNE